MALPRHASALLRARERVDPRDLSMRLVVAAVRGTYSGGARGCRRCHLPCQLAQRSSTALHAASIASATRPAAQYSASAARPARSYAASAAAIRSSHLCAGHWDAFSNKSLTARREEGDELRSAHAHIGGGGGGEVAQCARKCVRFEEGGREQVGRSDAAEKESLLQPRQHRRRRIAFRVAAAVAAIAMANASAGIDERWALMLLHCDRPKLLHDEDDHLGSEGRRQIEKRRRVCAREHSRCDVTDEARHRTGR